MKAGFAKHDEHKSTPVSGFCELTKHITLKALAPRRFVLMNGLVELDAKELSKVKGGCGCCMAPAYYPAFAYGFGYGYGYGYGGYGYGGYYYW
jgi:hypothetical protein